MTAFWLGAIVADAMIGANPDKALLRKITASAKKEHRGLGPMLCEIARRYYALVENHNESKREERLKIGDK